LDFIYYWLPYLHFESKAEVIKGESEVVQQQEIDKLGHTYAPMDQENNAQMVLENALNIEDIFWQEKAKVKWRCNGHINTSYFHRIAKV